MEQRCLGCMERKSSGPVCEHCGFDEQTQNAPHQLPLGTVLGGHYLVGKALGQGGFGITYLGWDTVLDMAVAVKEFFPRGAAARDSDGSNRVVVDQSQAELYEENKKRFLQEARVMVQLERIPQIVRVWNLLEENNTAYIIMEYVRGRNLREYIRNGGENLRPRELFALLRPTMEALDKIHERGYVHRDISPDNIMLIPEGTKLLDFGAVRYVEKAEVDKVLTHSTKAILKHGFAPIEQYQSRGSLGPWTDVHALCGTIYFCLTGEIPPEAGARIMDGIDVDWAAIPGLTLSQVEALKKGMAVLPKDRTASVKELCASLFLSPEEEARQLQERQRLERLKLEEARREQERLLREKQEAERRLREKQERERLERERQEKERLKQEKLEQEQLRRERLVREKQEKQAKKKQQQEEKKKKTWLLSLIAVLVLLLGAAALFGGKEKASLDVPAETMPVTETTLPETMPVLETTAAETEPHNYREENILMPNRKEGAGEKLVFGTQIGRKEIASLTFQDHLENAPADALDISQLKNGRVLAWTEKNGELYDLYIAAQGGVYAPEDSSDLFRDMSNMKSVNFGGAFHTEDVRNMDNMFRFCTGLKELDVSGFATGNVTSMEGMFYACRGLRQLDLGNFHTENVTSMASMFDNCSALAYLNVSSFDTAAVTTMKGMFYGCWSLPELDVSSFDTSAVTNMQDMFHGCRILQQLDVSGFHVANVTEMVNMFYDCPVAWPRWYTRDKNKGFIS